ncbi:MAG: DNA polymerase IV [Nakamurella sp.]
MAHQTDSGRQVTADPTAVDDSECTILHVDMDAFYAMVEVRRRPELRGRPMMVAGTGGRGVVLSASYEARAHGIRSAMPTSRALALCRGIAVVQPDMGAYAEASRAVMAVFADVTPLVEPLSVDEAFLDISGAGRQFGRPAVIAQQLRKRISSELGLIATVGAASTKFVAKLASGLAKPDGLLIVPPADVLGLLHPLPIRALWGVGPRTAERLQSLGIGTIGEIAALPLDQLIRTLGTATGTKLHDLSWGRDERTVQTAVAESSIGAETTFAADTSDPAYLARQLLALTEKTAARARLDRVRGRTVSIKVRFQDFSTVTRSATLPVPTDLSRIVYATAHGLLHKLRASSAGGQQVRLLGVRLEGLIPVGEVVEQLELGSDDPRPGWREAQGAIDRAVARFGSTAVLPATLLDHPKKPVSSHHEDESARDLRSR